MHNHLEKSMSTVIEITKEELKLTLEGDEMKWIGAMTKTAVKFLLIMKGTTMPTLLKCFEKCQQRIYKMALMPQRVFVAVFCARNDFFSMTVIEAENALGELLKC